MEADNETTSIQSCEVEDLWPDQRLPANSCCHQQPVTNSHEQALAATRSDVINSNG